MDGFAHSLSPVRTPPRDSVVLVECDNDSVVGSLLLQYREGLPLKEARQVFGDMGEDARMGLFLEALEGLGIHDSVPRQWEFFRAVFEVVTSSSAYAQLKRHRMCTRLASVYDPALGITVPPSVIEKGLEGDLVSGVRRAEEYSGSLGRLFPYMLTNSHRRRVTLDMDGRELYHFSRLREDEHAQWDIREIAGSMMESVRREAPLTMMLAGGKSEFEDSG
jgi:hypothetical protein